MSYLPLLLPTIRKHLVELCLDESSAAALSDDSIWFEAAGEAWRWSVLRPCGDQGVGSLR